MRCIAAGVLSVCLALWGCAGGTEEMPEPAGGSRPTPTLPPLPPAVGPSPDYSKFELVPLIRLLVMPTSMDRKAVSVQGYLSLPPSGCIDCGSMLCFHKEDAENLLGTNCLGLEVPDSAGQLNHRYVEIQGVVGIARYNNTHVFIRNIKGIAPIANQEQAEADLWRK